jgi:hypothetical protein
VKPLTAINLDSFRRLDPRPSRKRGRIQIERSAVDLVGHPARQQRGAHMSLWLLILIIVVVVLALGGFGFSRR